MTCAELQGNLQRYRIKSLYGNKLNLALVENPMTKTAKEFAQQLESSGVTSFARQAEETMKEVSEAFHKQFGNCPAAK